MKEGLKAINKEYKQELISSLNLDRVQIIQNWKNDGEEILKLEPIEKLIALYQNLPTLSMFTDNEVLSLLESFGITKDTTKYFVSIEDFFKPLDEFQETHNYSYLYMFIWFYYNDYSLNFFKKKLDSDFNLDLNKKIAKVIRQEKNGNLHEKFGVQKNKFKQFKELINEEMTDYKFPFDGQSVISPIRKVISFPHKIVFFNLYMQLKEFNENIDINNFHEPDFKCEFYDLLEILFRDKSILNNSDDAQLNYGNLGNRRFKIKRVERLILS
jgi:hypothetical protein